MQRDDDDNPSDDGTSAAAEVLSDAALTADHVARACRVTIAWVEERVQTGVLQADPAADGWRFDSGALVRARRIARLETCFDADPQLAALTVDLIEDVARLRHRLHLLGETDP
jgi:chaperone modulatory protein CbpM